MDTSKEYIKMCDCPEIQHAKTSLERDGHSFHVNLPHPKYGDKFKRITWLPRQDQIQEMCGTHHADKNGKWFCWICTMVRFNRFLEGFINQDFEHEIECFNKHKDFQMPSMEQLWLAFYMSEKHQKFWDSKKEQWIKSE